MIDYVPVTHYELCFPKGKELPLYVYYTLLGQEYEALRNDPSLLKDRCKDPDYVLDVLHTALNGFPEPESVFPDNNVRAFKVRYTDGCGKTHLARVCFYIDTDCDTLCCNIRRGHYGPDNNSDTCTHIIYEPGQMTWEWNSDILDSYGLLNWDKEELDD